MRNHDKDNYHIIDRLLERKSSLFRFPHDQLNDEQTSGINSNLIVELLSESFERICSRLDVKSLDEYYSTSQTYSHLFTQQQRTFGHSTENLDTTSTGDDRAFTDLNLRISKRSFQAVISPFKIDYALVNRIALDWPVLFTQIIARLKSNIIYHFITLRFEFQGNSTSSLNDTERLAVGKLVELLPAFFSEKK